MAGLSGKAAIVTGASGGIGAAIAEGLASRGAAVMVAFSGKEEGARATVRDIRAANGGADMHAADLLDAAAVIRLFDAAIDAFGGPDVVVCNTGTYLQKPLAETGDDEFDRVFGVNARGTFLCLREAARRLRDGGRIVVTSSVATQVVWPGHSVYAGSKAATEQFVAILSRELGPRGITVNAVAPGATDTGMMPDEVRRMAPSQTALGRIGHPDDIADAVAFLCSEQARWVTGRVLPVDGGIAP